jgi:hypothetical protein
MATARIYPTRTISGNQPVSHRIIEESAQTTLLDGIPVQLKADGGVGVWDGTTLAAGIAGISGEGGHNLTTTGVAQQTVVSGSSVPFETLAQVMARPGANDGKILFYPAAADTVFFGEVGPAQTTAASDRGKNYGMTIDTDNHWFVDKTKTAANAVVNVVEIDTLFDTVRGVWFTFLPAAAQITA